MQIEYGVYGDFNYTIPKAIFYLLKGNYTLTRFAVYDFRSLGWVLPPLCNCWKVSIKQLYVALHNSYDPAYKLLQGGGQDPGLRV